MINFDYITKENVRELNPNREIQIPDHPYRILIIRDSRSEKTNVLLNLISHHPDIDKIHLYSKGPCKAKYWLLINKRGGAGLKQHNDLKAFIEYSNDMNNIYEEENPKKEHKMLIVFDDMIADLGSSNTYSNSNWTTYQR